MGPIRIIPIVLFNGAQAVKTRRFSCPRNVGSVVNVARVYAGRSVDELVFLDIRQERHSIGPDFDTVTLFAKEMNCPFSVGGGIRTVQDAVRLLDCGADRVVVKRDGAELVPAIANEIGRQAVIYACDLYGPDCEKQLITAANMGAGEVLVQSVDRDGTMEGFDLRALLIADRIFTKTPFIWASGAGSHDDFIEAAWSGAQAIAASSAFHFTAITPDSAKNALREDGFKVRQ